MLGIETKLLIAFYFQTDGQIERMNQKLEQYLRFFVNYRQKNWLEQLASAEFVINNKVHSAIKMPPFMANYRRELRKEIDVRRKEKLKKVMEFVKRIKKIQKGVETALKRVQEEIKQQANRGRNEAEIWKMGDKVMLSIKDFVFKERLAKKLVDQYVDPYTIDKVVSTNIVKLQLPTLMRIHLVVNVSQVV